MSGAIEVAMCAVALLFGSVRLGLGRPIILVVVLPFCHFTCAVVGSPDHRLTPVTPE